MFRHLLGKVAALVPAKIMLTPLVALATTVLVSVAGINGLWSGYNAVQSLLQSTQSERQLAAIASGIQRVNGNLYHALTVQAAQARGGKDTDELDSMLADTDDVTVRLKDWHDTNATPEQQRRIDMLVVTVAKYKDALDWVGQMADVDFASAASFLHPFDENFHAMEQEIATLVNEVEIAQRSEATAATTNAMRTIWVFAGVAVTSLVLALFAAATMARTTIRALLTARQNDVLSKLTQIDALTGIGNRRCFDDTLASVWTACASKQSNVTLVLFDIDHFKKFNDSFGHQAGDDCLRQVGAALAACRKGNDIVARYGGEEFAVILPDTPLEGGCVVAERVRLSILSCAIPHPVAGPPGCVTVSLGVACMPAATGTPSALIEAADQCLYEAKRSGRNRVSHHCPPQAPLSTATPVQGSSNDEPRLALSTAVS